MLRDTRCMAVADPPADRQAIHDELERARRDFRRLVTGATASRLHVRTHGTRWTNQQMLFHMAFGYLVVRRLLPLVRVFGALPDGVGRTFARLLQAGTRPFHVINYLGSCGGAVVFRGAGLTRLLDRTAAALHRQLDAESDEGLARRMHFPLGWDPFFRDTMTLEGVYRYATQHYDFHRRQLTLEPLPPS